MNAYIISILKKSSHNSNKLCNYEHIPQLPIISKVIESILFCIPFSNLVSSTNKSYLYQYIFFLKLPIFQLIPIIQRSKLAINPNFITNISFQSHYANIDLISPCGIHSKYIHQLLLEIFVWIGKQPPICDKQPMNLKYGVNLEVKYELQNVKFYF